MDPFGTSRDVGEHLASPFRTRAGPTKDGRPVTFLPVIVAKKVSSPPKQSLTKQSLEENQALLKEQTSDHLLSEQLKQEANRGAALRSIDGTGLPKNPHNKITEDPFGLIGLDRFLANKVPAHQIYSETPDHLNDYPVGAPQSCAMNPFSRYGIVKEYCEKKRKAYAFCDRCPYCNWCRGRGAVCLRNDLANIGGQFERDRRQDDSYVL